MKISHQVIAVPTDIDVEKITSWIRFRLSELNAELDEETVAQVRVELTPRMVRRITQAGIDDLMMREVNRHSQIKRIVAEEVDEA
jgi:hypothetical protein